MGIFVKNPSDAMMKVQEISTLSIDMNELCLETIGSKLEVVDERMNHFLLAYKYKRGDEHWNQLIYSKFRKRSIIRT